MSSSGSTTSRPARIATILGAAAVAAGALLVSQPASASATTWNLDAYGQTICRQPTVDDFTGYWLGSVTGTWTSPISVGLEDVPGVGTIPTGGSLAPGSNTSEINVGGNFNFAMPQPGTYTVLAYATDGTTTETSPITFEVKTDCGA